MTKKVRADIIGAHYFSEAFTKPGKLIRNAKAKLKGHRFDVIACTGISGLSFAPVLSYSMNKRLLIVRKKDDKSAHSASTIEAYIRRHDRVLLVDDFRSSGATVARMTKLIDKLELDMYVIGTYFYKYDNFEVNKNANPYLA